MGDWLGTDKTRNFRPFKEAREFVHTLKIKNQNEWANYCNSGNRPENIPSNPIQVYKNKGWSSWGDWCGNNNIAEKYNVWKTFDQAIRLVRSLPLTGFEEWEKYCKSDA